MKTRKSNKYSLGKLGHAWVVKGCLTLMMTLMLSVTSAHAQAARPFYDVIRIGDDLPKLSYAVTYPWGINRLGEVVGTYNDLSGYSRAYRWKNGAAQDLGTLGGSSAGAEDINDSGQVVGWAAVSGDTSTLAFLWDPATGAMQSIGWLDPANAWSAALGINNAGQIVGSSFVQMNDSTSEHAFLWEDGAMSDLGTLGGDWSVAYGINDAGQIIGSSKISADDPWIWPFLWQGGSMANLSIPEPCHQCAPTDINNAGQVVGFWYDYNPPPGITETKALLWDNGVLQYLPGLGGTRAGAFGINNKGQVVGGASLAGDTVSHAVLWENGVAQDLNSLIDPHSGWVLEDAYSINDSGWIGGTGSYQGIPYSTFLLKPRLPVLIIPGIGGTYAANLALDYWWLTGRGADPSDLQIDPLALTYHDLIKTLENVGYVRDQDLFVVNYDWRLPPGPSDGSLDGRVDGLTGSSITDPLREYGVDYLGHFLKQSKAAWEAQYPGKTLEEVDVIAHSTGGLVARTYIQSGAYGGTFAGGTLPKVRDLIMVGVPNQGASKAWNPMHDNWVVDPVFQMVVSKVINRAYEKVLAGEAISGPDYDIDLNSISPPHCADLPEVCFVNQYVPTIRSLLATYDFIDFGSGLSNVNGIAGLRNALLLDLNAGAPNAFADDANVTIIYGTGKDTPELVRERMGQAGGQNAIASFTQFMARDAQPGEVWYEDVVVPGGGDGTVPLISSVGQFVGDPRVRLEPFSGVDHGELVSDAQAQERMLEILGVRFSPGDISTSLHLSIGAVCAVSGCANFILDPAEGFLVDGLGRHLGYSGATGPLAEIPESVWFGNADGIGWVFGSTEKPLTLELSGLGENYYVMVSVLTPTDHGGVVDRGFLAQGQTKVLPVSLVSRTGDTLAPTAVLTAPSQVSVGESFTLDGSGSFDTPPGHVVRYIWTLLQGGGSSNFTVGVPIETTTSTIQVTVNPANPIPPGTATFQLVVVDDSGNPSQPDARQVTIGETVAPTAVLSAPSQVAVGESFVLDGSGSFDLPPGHVVRYIWTLLQGGGSSNFTVGVPIETTTSTIQVTVNPANPIPPGTATFQLVVVDDSGNPSQPDARQVTIGETVAPTAVLSAPSQVAVGESFVLDGSGSFDPPPGHVVRYIWTMLQGGGESSFTVGVPIETTTSTIQVTVNPANPIPPGTATFQLLVVDDSGNPSQPDARQVTLLDKSPPVFSGVPGPITVEATSSEGAVVTYTPPTAIDVVSGSVPVTCEPPSGSLFPLGSTTVTCTASDGSGNSASESFSVTVELTHREAVLCGMLQGGALPDVDGYAFQGSKGETVTVTLAADPSGTYQDGRAALALLGIGLLKTDGGALPNSVIATLPRSGAYYVTVSEAILGKERFSGAYCVTLESSGNAWQTFRRR